MCQQENIVDAMNGMAELFKECSAFMEAVEVSLGNALANSGFSYKAGKRETRWDDAKWVYLALLKNYAISHDGALKGGLGVGIDLGGTLAANLGQPLAVVCWGPNTAESEWGWEGAGGLVWPLNEKCSLAGKSVIMWDQENTGSLSTNPWFYLLPLLRVHEPDDVRKLIVDPVMAMLNGDNDAVICPPDSALRFREEGGTIVRAEPAYPSPS